MDQRDGWSVTSTKKSLRIQKSAGQAVQKSLRYVTCLCRARQDFRVEDQETTRWWNAARSASVGGATFISESSYNSISARRAKLRIPDSISAKNFSRPSRSIS